MPTSSGAQSGMHGRMDPERRHAATVARQAAERFDELADVAELMGDTDGAFKLRHRAAATRERAMLLLDD